MGGSDTNNQIDFKCVVEFPNVPYSQKRDILALASLKAPILQIEEGSRRPTIDIICVIDKSGSMAGEKLSLMKDALSFIVDQLGSNDSIGLVTYDSVVTTDLELFTMTTENKKVAKQVISQIKAGTMTNLSGGLLSGLTMASNRKSLATVCSILLFTDGLANVGMTTLNQLTMATENKLKKCTDSTTVFTFGFGPDHDANMLQSIAMAGKGMYYFVESADQIPLSFADCIGGLQSTVAQNLKLTVTAKNDAKILKVLGTGFKTTTTNPGNEIEISLGDLYSEEERDILISFVVPQITAATPIFEFCLMKLDYFNVITTNDHHSLAGGALIRSQSLECGERSHEIERHATRIETALAMENGRKLADQGRFEEARSTLLEVRSKNQEYFVRSNNDVLSVGLTADLDDVLEDVKEETYLSKGRQKLISKSQSHQVQRSSNSKVERAMYETSAKVGKKVAFFH